MTIQLMAEELSYYEEAIGVKKDELAILEEKVSEKKLQLKVLEKIRKELEVVPLGN